MSYSDCLISIHNLANKNRARISASFFKTGPGQYGEGDIFIGVTVPETRRVAKQFSRLSLLEVKKLLKSKIHEERLLALLILAQQFSHGDDQIRIKIFNFYQQNIKQVNNWDLVDLSADKIVGAYLLDKPTDWLFVLAQSKNLWERRIAIVSTFYFIKQNKFNDTLALAEILLKDTHDLIHKAVGWMLREVGKRDQLVLDKFLSRHYQQMPRTMLRYAIERLAENKRQAYLKNMV